MYVPSVDGLSVSEVFLLSFTLNVLRDPFFFFLVKKTHALCDPINVLIYMTTPQLVNIGY